MNSNIVENRCLRCGLSFFVDNFKHKADGLCDLCATPTAAPEKFNCIEAEQIIRKLVLEKKENQNDEFDAIVLYSGGKDSTYLLSILQKEIKLNPLVVTFNNWYQSLESQENIKTILKATNLNHLFVTPPWNFTNELLYTSLSNVGKPQFEKQYKNYGLFCWPCFSAIYSYVVKLAQALKIHVIIGGWSPGQIGVGSHKNLYNGLIYLPEVIEQYVKPFKDMVLADENCSELSDVLINPEQAKDIYLLPFYQYWPYDKGEILRYIERLGWIRPSDIDGCSSNCRLNIADRYLFRKRFGFDRYEIQTASMVRAGYMDRAETIRIFEENLDAFSAEAIIGELQNHGRCKSNE